MMTNGVKKKREAIKNSRSYLLSHKSSLRLAWATWDIVSNTHTYTNTHTPTKNNNNQQQHEQNYKELLIRVKRKVVVYGMKSVWLSG